VNQQRRTHGSSRPKANRCAIGIVAALTATFLGFGCVSARDQAPTADEKEACMEDVFRLCSSQIPDRAAITACLRAKQASLSHQCRYVMSTRDTTKGKADSR